MRKGEATRQTILDEATRLASQVGLGGLTIGSLATQTELSKSGLFAHFRSKESLQVQVLEHAAVRFREQVVAPTLAAPRGEPRLRELFARWLAWVDTSLPGGCIFISAGIEFDDQPGAVRNQVAQAQRTWFDTIARVAADGGLPEGTDPAQFAQDLYGVMLAYHLTKRLLGDPEAGARAERAFDTLLR
jgi:AcrR family transcriptional regulator